MSGNSTGTDSVPSDALRVVIIGAGVSGLSTAFYLKPLGIRSTIVEQSERLGGLIQTDRVDGCDLEAGPDSFLAAKTSVAELARDLGIKHRLIGSNDSSRKIFVVRRNRLVEMPKGMVLMVPSDWIAVLGSPLFSLATKWRFLREYSFRPRQRNGDFSIAEMMSQHFGQEALDYLTEPLLSGVYGGDAARLSAPSVLPRFVEYEATHGSLIRGVRATKTQEQARLTSGKSVTNQRQTSGKPGTVPIPQTPKIGTVPAETHASSPSGLFMSFQGGMQTLVDSLASTIRDAADILPAQAQSVHPTASGWRVETKAKSIEADHLILACPAHVSAKLLSASAPTLSALLSEIPYSSSVLITLLFQRDQISHPLNGFGFLVPPPERRTIAAATWINTKFPSRVAPNRVAVRAFLVDPEAERLGELPDSEVLQAVLTDLRLYMQITAIPLYAEVHRWPKSMPQYVVGHSARVASIREQLLRLPGLHLSSNFLDGVGIPDCIRNAQTTAARIKKVKNHSSS